MKKLIVILAFFLFTLTSESATPSYDSPKEVDKMLIMHNTGT